LILREAILPAKNSPEMAMPHMPAARAFFEISASRSVFLGVDAIVLPKAEMIFGNGYLAYGPEF